MQLTYHGISIMENTYACNLILSVKHVQTKLIQYQTELYAYNKLAR
jgi:hypothetical protein